METSAANELIKALLDRGKTVAAAESLTGGLVAAAITSAPGTSKCFQGGVVTYATSLKAQILGVDRELLDRCGPVDGEVAAQMAVGVCRVCSSDYGLATTGVAGPDKQDGVEVGTVFIAFHDAQTGHTVVDELQLEGSRTRIRAQTVAAVCELAARAIVV